MPRKSENGAAAVEFALILPIFLLLVFGIIEFGFLLYNKQVITNASREGARYGIVSTGGSRHSLVQITDVVDTYAASHLVTFGTASPPVTTIDNSGGTLFGDDLTVTVTYHYDFLFLPNFIASLAGGTDIQGVTVMKYE
jgi:Flp pilus assembly protein TadG